MGPRHYKRNSIGSIWWVQYLQVFPRGLEKWISTRLWHHCFLSHLAPLQRWLAKWLTWEPSAEVQSSHTYRGMCPLPLWLITVYIFDKCMTLPRKFREKRRYKELDFCSSKNNGPIGQMSSQPVSMAQKWLITKPTWHSERLRLDPSLGKYRACDRKDRALAPDPSDLRTEPIFCAWWKDLRSTIEILCWCVSTHLKKNNFVSLIKKTWCLKLYEHIEHKTNIHLLLSECLKAKMNAWNVQTSPRQQFFRSSSWCHFRRSLMSWPENCFFQAVIKSQTSELSNLVQRCYMMLLSYNEVMTYYDILLWFIRIDIV